MNQRRVIRGALLLSGFFLVAVLALVLLLPMLIDSEAVKGKARAFIAEKTNGLARIEKIDLVWFPHPGVVMQNVAVAFDQEIQGNVQQLRLYPSMRHLLTGNVAFTNIIADRAAWRVRLPAQNEAPFNFGELEEKVRAAVKGLAPAFPGVNFQIHGGAADIGIGAGPPLIIQDIDAELGVTADKLGFTISARSNVSDRIRFAGEMAAGNLVSEARFSVENLGLRQIFDFVSPAAGAWIGDGAATLSLRLRTVGLKSFSAELVGAPLSLTLVRGSRKALIKTDGIKATVIGDDQALRVAVDELSLAAPPLKAAGEFIYDRSSSTFAVKLNGRELDAGMIRESALLLADDVAGVRNVFRYLQGGAIAEIRAETRGRSFAEALHSQQAVVTATLRGGRIFVPGPDLDLENVAGSLLISGGVLECKGCSATLGKAKGRDGALRVGISGPGAPFHCDILVESDARELQSLLVRHVKDGPFRRELSRIRHIAGSLSGRLVLGESLDAISARVSAVPAALSASYEPVPYPISLTKGRLNYDNGKIDAESLEGAVGRSAFAGLSGAVRADGTGQLSIQSANVQLDLEQTEVMLRKVETIQAKLGAKTSARGKIDFASISLTGPLRDPSQWNFIGRGKVAGLSVTHALLPAPVAIAQGTFDATREKLTFGETKVQMLDASLTVGGVIENWRKTPLRVDATVSGITGAQTMEWVRRQTEVSTDYLPRSPLEFSASRVVFRDDTDFSFNGKLTVARGPRLAIDMTRNLRGFTIKELSIDDGGRLTRATFESDGDRWGVAFSGTLNKQTMGRIFLTAPVPLGLLQGDFAVSAFRKPPFRLSARGNLAAKDLVPHLKGEDAIIDQIIVQGDHAGLDIRSADLRWRRSHIAVSGKLSAAQETLQVDMDVSADRLAWDELSDVFGRGEGQGSKGQADLQLPPVEGVIRLKTDRFNVDALSWNPFQVTVGLTANGVTGEVENSLVCGIRTAGRFTVQKNDRIDLHARLTVKDGELDSTSRCLSIEKSDISGTYSLDAQLTGSGNREQLARTLSGGFDFAARDGKFIRAPGVNATFDYLNRTGDFNMAFPDLNQEALPYSFISAKGTLERQIIFAREVIIEASPYAITAQGKADLEQNTVDAKGLVTVLVPAAKIIKNIPLVGAILSGSLVGIPVEVSGSMEQPRVSYLSPEALGAEMVNIPLRILNVPLDALMIFTPRQP